MKRDIIYLSFLLFMLVACTTKKSQRLDREGPVCVWPESDISKNTDKTIGDYLDSVRSEMSIYDRLLLELDSTEIYNDSILYGYWFQPHAACIINIFLHKDNTYEFKYCENGKGDEVKDILKTGKYSFNGEVITLTSDEGWDSYFNGVIYYKHNGTCYYLTDKKDGFYLVKGSD